MELKTKYNIKLNNFYNCVMALESVTMDCARKLLQATSAGEDVDGMTSDAIKLGVEHGLFYIEDKHLCAVHHENRRKKISQLAKILADKVHNDFAKTNDTVQDTVQPEQERPIVTANDQMNQRIDRLESQVLKIITLFKPSIQPIQ